MQFTPMRFQAMLLALAIVGSVVVYSVRTGPNGSNRDDAAVPPDRTLVSPPASASDENKEPSAMQQGIDIKNDGTDLQTSSAASSGSDEPTVEQRKRAVGIVNSVRSHQLTFDQLMKSPDFRSLPENLKDQVIGEAVGMLNRGEITPSQFLAAPQ